LVEDKHEVFEVGRGGENYKLPELLAAAVKGSMAE
jgi:hypothetical protein